MSKKCPSCSYPYSLGSPTFHHTRQRVPGWIGLQLRNGLAHDAAAMKAMVFEKAGHPLL